MAKDLTTLTGLTSKLEDELGWRRKEMKLIKDQIPLLESPLQKALLRSSTAILYAHWEGFIKNAASCYLEHISLKYLPNNLLHTRFLTLSILNKVGSFSGGDLQSRFNIIQTLFTDYKKQSNVPKKNIINTKSNLRHDVLKEILFVLNLENDTHIELRKSLIDDLVDTRNFIAHGEYKSVNYSTFIEIHDDVIALMTYVKTKIENDAVLQTYKLNNPIFN